MKVVKGIVSPEDCRLPDEDVVIAARMIGVIMSKSMIRMTSSLTLIYYEASRTKHYIFRSKPRPQLHDWWLSSQRISCYVGSHFMGH
jgi:hypothetical protein